jgi:hypothetical protein
MPNLRHVIKKTLFPYFEPLWLRLASELGEIAIKSQKIFYGEKF